MRPDPRIRQNLDRISTTLESAADSASAGCFTFTKTYLEPCFSSISSCVSCPQPRRAREHNRVAREGAALFPFAFYDDEFWDYDDDDDGGDRRGRVGEGGPGGWMSWGTDELDRLLAGSGNTGGRRREERMSYGASGGGGTGYGTTGGGGQAGQRKKNSVVMGEADPTVIPSSSWFGFLSVFGVRGRGMRYKPSAANLQEHPGARGLLEVEDEDALPEAEEEEEEEEWYGRRLQMGSGTGRGRKRAGTQGSGESSRSGDGSFRSRGDLWPSSEDEDDAVVIGDDAFPRSDGESFLGGLGERELRDEEERVEREEEEEVKRKRERARRLAMERGLSRDSVSSGTTSPRRTQPTYHFSASPEPYTYTIPSPSGSPEPHQIPPLSLSAVGRSHSSPRPFQPHQDLEKRTKAASVTAASPREYESLSPRSMSPRSVRSARTIMAVTTPREEKSEPIVRVEEELEQREGRGGHAMPRPMMSTGSEVSTKTVEMKGKETLEIKEDSNRPNETSAPAPTATATAITTPPPAEETQPPPPSKETLALVPNPQQKDNEQ